jgi:hypothetical protein
MLSLVDYNLFIFQQICGIFLSNKRKPGEKVQFFPLPLLLQFSSIVSVLHTWSNDNENKTFYFLFTYK